MPYANDDLHPHRAVIQPVPSGQLRPLWSVMIPTFNCADYLRETLTSVLAQDPGSELMQIEVIDDCSSQDNPEAVVKELGKGRVKFYRQPENVGYIRNFETCLQRSQGHLVHLLHGDDCVRTGFYQKMQALFEQKAEIGSAFCRQIIIDDQGHWQRFSPLEQQESAILSNWLERIASNPSIQTPSVVVRRDVYEKLGGFDRRISSCGEDWEMWVRIAAHYPVAYEVEPLALYRDRSGSLTKRSIRNGQNIRDVRLATDIIAVIRLLWHRHLLPSKDLTGVIVLHLTDNRYTHAYLAPDKAAVLTRRAKESWASWAFFFVEYFLMQGDLKAAKIQLQEGLRCSYSWSMLKQASSLLLRIMKQQLKQAIYRTALFKYLRDLRYQDAR